MGYAVISYDLHQADSDTYVRLNKALKDALFEKVPGIDTVWRKPVGASNVSSTSEIAEKEFMKAAKEAACLKYTFYVFASASDIDTRRVEFKPVTISKILETR